MISTLQNQVGELETKLQDLETAEAERAALIDQIKDLD